LTIKSTSHTRRWRRLLFRPQMDTDEHG